VYAKDSPVNFVDPSGRDASTNLISQCLGGILAGLAVAAVGIILGVILSGGTLGLALFALALFFSVPSDALIIAIVGGCVGGVVLQAWLNFENSNGIG
jgi:hypothetical protein